MKTRHLIRAEVIYTTPAILSRISDLPILSGSFFDSLIRIKVFLPQNPILYTSKKMQRTVDKEEEKSMDDRKPDQSSDDLLGIVIQFPDLVDDQEGSIVSRTIIDKKEGTITVFALDAGQGLSEHTAPFDALIQLIEGRTVVNIGGRDHSLSAGESIIMPANIPHTVTAGDRSKMILTMIRA